MSFFFKRPIFFQTSFFSNIFFFKRDFFFQTCIFFSNVILFSNEHFFKRDRFFKRVFFSHIENFLHKCFLFLDLQITCETCSALNVIHQDQTLSIFISSFIRYWKRVSTFLQRRFIGPVTGRWNRCLPFAGETYWTCNKVETGVPPLQGNLLNL